MDLLLNGQNPSSIIHHASSVMSHHASCIFWGIFGQCFQLLVKVNQEFLESAKTKIIVLFIPQWFYSKGFSYFGLSAEILGFLFFPRGKSHFLTIFPHKIVNFATWGTRWGSQGLVGEEICLRNDL